MKPTTKPIEYTKAIIYCRVSSKRQTDEGHGLDNQELRCTQYADLKGYEVVAVFKDDVSGGGDFMNRPKMRELIKFLDAHKKTNYVVIFDDLKRFARDTEFHIKLRNTLAVRGARRECLNFSFEDNSSGRFVETIHAAHNQMEREDNKERVLNNMKARLEAGYWAFHPPTGLKNVRDDSSKIIEYLVFDEPLAGIIKEAIEKYRDFELPTHEAVRQFILGKYQQHGIKRPLSLNGVKRILTNPVYAGCVEYLPWGVTRRDGHNIGLISKDTFQKVQDRINLVAKPRLRKDYSEDFPLRAFVLCPECRKPCTAAWFKGKSGARFAYYLCKQVDCLNRQKMIQKFQIDKDFGKLVKDLKPKPKAAEMVQQFLLDAWDNRKKFEATEKAGVMQKINEMDNKVDDLIELVRGTKNQMLIKRYESEMEKLLQDKEDLGQQMKKETYSQSNFAHIQEVVVKHLQNPIEMWETKEIERKRLLLNMYFSRGVVYNKKIGFQTPDLPLIVKVLTSKNTSKNSLVEMMGVKPMSKTRL